jgi:hypothetical protein
VEISAPLIGLIVAYRDKVEAEKVISSSLTHWIFARAGGKEMKRATASEPF